jgi:putative ABC transport system permease protein
MVTSLLIKKIFRDLIDAKGQFISIVIIISLGVASYTGINATFRNLATASETYYSEYSLADYWISLNRISSEGVSELRGLPDVESASGRITTEFTSFSGGDSSTLKAMGLPGESDAQVHNKVWIKSGRYIEEDTSQCLIDENYFNANGLSLGVPIDIYYEGTKLSVIPVGTVRSPEFVYLLKDSSEIVPDPVHYGLIYMSDKYLGTLTGLMSSFNEVTLGLKDGADMDSLRKAVEDMMEPYGLIVQYERKDQLSYAMLDQEIAGLRYVSGSFPMVFMGIASVIMYLMMGRLVDYQRTQIGVFKAFGFTNRKILFMYMSYGFVMTAFGSLLGAGLGMAMGKWMTELENEYFHLPLQGMKLYAELIIPATCLMLLFSSIASFKSSKRAYMLSPSEAMKVKVPQSGRYIILEKINFLWKRISLSWRMALRNLFRHKVRNVMTAICVTLATALLTVSFGMMDTVNSLIESQYVTIQNYDIKVTTSKLIPKTDWRSFDSLPNVMKAEPLLELGVELKNGHKKKSVGLIGLKPDATLYRVIDRSGNALPVARNGIMMPGKLAEKLGVGLSSGVKAKILLPGKREMDVTYSKEIFQYLGMNAVSSLDQANRLLGEGSVANSFVIKLRDPEKSNELKEYLKTWKSVSSVQTKTDSLDNLMELMGTMTSSMIVIILIAGVLSVASMYNVATISIFERQREFATMKIMGMRLKEIGRIVFNENYIITALSAVMSIPAASALGAVMSRMYEADAYSFKFNLGLSSYAGAIVLSFVFTFLSNMWLSKKLKKLDMTSVLKNMD